MNKSVTNDRVTRWLFLLQEFNITVINKPRQDNVVVDFPSRFTIDNECMSVKDSFHDEYIFPILTHSLWYAYIDNYLAVGRFPQHLS